MYSNSERRVEVAIYDPVGTSLFQAPSREDQTGGRAQGRRTYLAYLAFHALFLAEHSEPAKSHAPRNRLPNSGSEGNIVVGDFRAGKLFMVHRRPLIE